MEKIYIVRYIGGKKRPDDDAPLEVALKKSSDFVRWLNDHNKKRKSNGELMEDENDFIIQPLTIFDTTPVKKSKK